MGPFWPNHKLELMQKKLTKYGNCSWNTELSFVAFRLIFGRLLLSSVRYTSAFRFLPLSFVLCLYFVLRRGGACKERLGEHQQGAVRWGGRGETQGGAAPGPATHAIAAARWTTVWPATEAVKWRNTIGARCSFAGCGDHFVWWPSVLRHGTTLLDWLVFGSL